MTHLSTSYRRSSPPISSPPIITRQWLPFLWIVAVCIIINKTFVKPFNTPTRADDFGRLFQALTRFTEHQPVYTEKLDGLAPHYLYNPGATVLLSPIAMISDYVETARLVFVILNSLAIIIGVLLLFRMARWSLTTVTLPIVLGVLYFTESVSNTLIFSNINGICFLLMVIVLESCARRRHWVPGLCLGILILIKPFFAVLLLCLFLTRLWVDILIAILTPVFMVGIGYLLLVDADMYRTKLVPYLSTPRPYSNASLNGVALRYDWPPALLIFTMTLCLVIGALGLYYSVYRFRTHRELMLVCVSTLLLVLVCLCGKLGQQYYTLFLLPFLITVPMWRKAHIGFLAWFGFAIVLSYNPSFTSEGFYPWTWVDTLTTRGWAMILLGITLLSIFDHPRPPLPLLKPRHRVTDIG